MKKLTLISLLIFNSLLVFSKIETVKLIYDKNEVYRGNTFKVKLRVESSTGKIFYSDVYNRFNCEKFKFNFSNGFEIIEKTSHCLMIKVNDSVLSNEVDVKLNYFYKPFKAYSFKIRIHDFIEELETFQINIKPENILSNSIVDFELVGQLSDGLLINVTDSGKLAYDKLKITVLEGGKVLNLNQIEVSDFGNLNSKLKIKVEVIDKPSMSSVFTYAVIRNPKIIVNLRGNDGMNGLVGGNGYTTQPKYIASGGSVGTKGMKGKNGLDGEKGKSIMIKVDLVYDHSYRDSVLKVDFFNDDNQTISKSYMMQKGKQVMLVNVSGGDGGTGGNGGIGGTGYTGYYGGNGGDGSDGGSGGDGGDIIISYTRSAEPYRNNIIVKSYGGKGGSYGAGGVIGKAGNTYYSTTETKVRSYGRVGYTGRDGRNGRDGRDGSVHFVLAN